MFNSEMMKSPDRPRDRQTQHFMDALNSGLTAVPAPFSYQQFLQILCHEDGLAPCSRPEASCALGVSSCGSCPSYNIYLQMLNYP